MVHSEKEGRVQQDFIMAMGTERSKPPLHNFNLPCLKWGNQRYLRCMKHSDSSSNGRNKNFSNGISGDRLRSNRSPPTKFLSSPDDETRRFKRPKSTAEEGIDAVREKLMFDFKAAADKMKDAILRKGVSEEDTDQRHDEEDEKVQFPPAAQTERPWNLRTRRAACKAPIAGNSVTGKSLIIEEKKISNFSTVQNENSNSPRLRGDKKDSEEETTEQVRAKFSAGLSKKEIEEDFMKMVGHRPARRPKKRSRTLQRQLDTLFPGMWLTEVTVDTYKVPEIPDNGKR